MSKCCWENVIHRLARRRVATNLQFVKNAVSAKHDKTRSAYKVTAARKEVDQAPWWHAVSRSSRRRFQRADKFPWEEQGQIEHRGLSRSQEKENVQPGSQSPLKTRSQKEFQPGATFQKKAGTLSF